MKTDKDEIRLNRRKVKEKGVWNWFVEQLKSEWLPSKENPYRPIQALLVFTKWVLIFYMIFVSLQAINFSFIMCESNVIENDDYVSARENWNDFLNDYKTTKHLEIYDEALNKDFEPVLSCDYDFNKVGNMKVREYLRVLKNNIKYKVPLWN